MDNLKFEPRVRYINGMMIYFRDKYTVTVSAGMTCIMFHRWFHRTLNSYTNSWRPFCVALTKKNGLKNIFDICKLADKYDVDHQTVTTTIKSIPPKGVRVIPEHYDYKKKQQEDNSLY